MVRDGIAGRKQKAERRVNEKTGGRLGELGRVERERERKIEKEEERLREGKRKEIEWRALNNENCF